MSVSYMDAITSYWVARRDHALGRARRYKRARLALERNFQAGRRYVGAELHEDDMVVLYATTENWVHEARRCNRELIRARVSKSCR